MSIIGIVGDALGGIFGLVDDLHTSDEERLEKKAELLKIETIIMSEVIASERAATEAQGKIITAEASSTHWITATWRPITMLSFLVLITLAQFGLTAPVPEQMWPLLTLGIGGYVVGRTVEKTASNVLSSLRSGERV